MPQQKPWMRWIVPLVWLGTLAYALAEDLTLTTYYPSPRGVYKELRVTDRVAIGTTNPTASHLEVLTTNPIDATGDPIPFTTARTSVQVTLPAATEFNTSGGALTNTAAAITNQAIDTSTNEQLTNIGLTVSAGGAERNYGLLVPQGQVGIGTTSPAATTALDVVGKLRLADGTEGANKVLTSDLTGVARWAASSGTTWRRIAFYSGSPAGYAYVVTSDLPAACTADNSRCEGMLMAVDSDGNAYWTASFDYLHRLNGVWNSVFNDSQGNGGVSTGINGGNTGGPIAQGPSGVGCYLYDDYNVVAGGETSASKFTLAAGASGATFIGCEVWVSGF